MHCPKTKPKRRNGQKVSAGEQPKPASFTDYGNGWMKRWQGMKLRSGW